MNHVGPKIVLYKINLLNCPKHWEQHFFSFFLRMFFFFLCIQSVIPDSAESIPFQKVLSIKRMRMIW